MTDPLALINLRFYHEISHRGHSVRRRVTCTVETTFTIALFLMKNYLIQEFNTMILRRAKYSVSIFHGF